MATPFNSVPLLPTLFLAASSGSRSRKLSLLSGGIMTHVISFLPPATWLLGQKPQEGNSQRLKLAEKLMGTDAFYRKSTGLSVPCADWLLDPTPNSQTSPQSQPTSESLAFLSSCLFSPSLSLPLSFCVPPCFPPKNAESAFNFLPSH